MSFDQSQTFWRRKKRSLLSVCSESFVICAIFLIHLFAVQKLLFVNKYLMFHVSSDWTLEDRVRVSDIQRERERETCDSNITNKVKLQKRQIKSSANFFTSFTSNIFFLLFSHITEFHLLCLTDADEWNGKVTQHWTHCSCMKSNNNNSHSVCERRKKNKMKNEAEEKKRVHESFQILKYRINQNGITIGGTRSYYDNNIMCVWCYIWYAVVNIRHIVSHRICMPSIHIFFFIFLLLLHSIHQNLNVPCIKLGKGRKENEHQTLVVLVPIKNPLSIEHFDMQNAFCYPNWWNHCR